MKPFILVFALFFTSAFLYAQEISITIVGLDGSDKITELEVRSANFTQDAPSSSSSSRRASSTSGAHYLINRSQDGHSPAIRSAIEKGRVFSKGLLVVRLPGGQKTTYTFSRFYLANYSSNNVQGEAATEEFKLIYESVDETN